MEQRRYERVGDTRDVQENPLTNSIARHNSHMRKSGIDPAGICSQYQLNRSAAELYNAYMRRPWWAKLEIMRVQLVYEKSSTVRNVCETAAPLVEKTLVIYLHCSPPTKANRVQSRPDHCRIIASGNRAGQCRWTTGFLRDFPFPPLLHFGTAPFSTHLALIDYQNLVIWILRADEGEIRLEWSNTGMKGWGKRETPEKIHRPAASSHTRKSGRALAAAAKGSRGPPTGSAMPGHMALGPRVALGLLLLPPILLATSLDKGEHLHALTAHSTSLCQLDEFERCRIVSLREAGRTFRRISRHLNHYAYNVNQCWTQWDQKGTHIRRKGSGRPRLTTSWDDRFIVRHTVRGPLLSVAARHPGTYHGSWTNACVHQLSIQFLPRRIGLDFRPDRSPIFACGNRSERCPWSAGFLRHLAFPPPFHSSATPYLLRFTPIGSLDLDVKSHPNLSTPLDSNNRLQSTAQPMREQARSRQRKRHSISPLCACVFGGPAVCEFVSSTLKTFAIVITVDKNQRLIKCAQYGYVPLVPRTPEPYNGRISRCHYLYISLPRTQPRAILGIQQPDLEGMRKGKEGWRGDGGVKGGVMRITSRPARRCFLAVPHFHRVVDLKAHLGINRLRVAQMSPSAG
ncbi:hypothetical protein PR048_020251 [Dryococelus australis]|uniref:Uncharacterized protein n=1 Tax=Dryococelus australis TaxID=614101 RepID=A0ABQ9H5U9_9NEOP|nr:hypothetical protein PR048_020251 [Dryococelus australis]